MTDFLLQEDGSSKFILEDSSGDLLLETAEITPPFIASATVVYTPSLPEVTAPFIASVTALFTPTFAYRGGVTISIAGTYSWICPSDTTQIYVECYGGGGGGYSDTVGNAGHGGGGGGAYAARQALAVTPGTTYTFIVGAGGTSPDQTTGSVGGLSRFTGDAGVKAEAAGGAPGSGTSAGVGGSTAASTGDIKFAGGSGGSGVSNASTGGAGGGASGNQLATGAAGTSSIGGTGTGQAGGVGSNGGGSGGKGSTYATNDAVAGSSPGGGGGGGGGQAFGAIGSDGRVVITPQVLLGFIPSVTVVFPATTNPGTVTPSFIGSVTVVHAPTLPTNITPGFIASVTVVYAPTMPRVDPPFISSHTVVYPIFSLFDPNRTFGGPGNGGEAFMVELNANGVTSTATLVASIGVGMGTMLLTGDGGLPSSVGFILTVDSEQIYVFPRGGGNYAIHGRGMGNTTVAVHTAGATVSWGDTYQQAILSTVNIDGSFTADITGSGSTLYPGWLICFDSSQAYLSGDRYPMHVTSVLGVFAAGAGTGGTNHTDQAQPNAISTPTGTSDDCPAALSNPSRISSNITAGDVAVVEYTNPEAVPLDLGPRSVALQSWFGLKRVDLTDHDVTFTNPNGIVVDTTGTYDTFTGSINGEWFEPDSIGIGPDTGTPTPNNVPYTSVTLPGTDRKFTFGSGGGGYNETGWPICCLAVRQGNKRVPFWQSWDWHDYSYVYTGFGTDATYAQILINRNGIIFGSVPEVDLPGPQDIDGPDAVWDDKEYHFGASWYVAIFGTPYLVFGPTIGGTGVTIPPGTPGGYTPGVTFPTSGSPSVTVPSLPPVEGGSGGGIGQPPVGLHIWATSGKGFS